MYKYFALITIVFVSALTKVGDSVLTFSQQRSSKDMIDRGPLFLEGIVCKGFGRGSKELGCPTANFEDKVEKLLPKEFPSGIYFGWAQVDDGEVYKMVMSIGWNPFFKNQKRTIETHILHEFANDFYGSHLKVAVLDYIRPEKNFTSKDELVNAIRNDIAVANDKLNLPVYLKYKDHEFFYTNLTLSTNKNSTIGSVNGNSV